MVKNLALCVFALTFVSFGYGNVVPSRGNEFQSNFWMNWVAKLFFFKCLADNQLAVPSCGGYMFVDDEVVIDGPFNQDCILQFQTQEDRILAFSVLDGDIKDALQFLNVTHTWIISIAKLVKSIVYTFYKLKVFFSYIIFIDSWRFRHWFSYSQSWKSDRSQSLKERQTDYLVH